MREHISGNNISVNSAIKDRKKKPTFIDDDEHRKNRRQHAKVARSRCGKKSKFAKRQYEGKSITARRIPLCKNQQQKVQLIDKYFVRNYIRRYGKK